MKKDDNVLFAEMRKTLYSAVLGDILDQMGYIHQFLPHQIHPLVETMVVAGRAFPVLEADIPGAVVGGHTAILDKSFGVMLEALDDLKENEVYLCSGSSLNYALVGELMCTRMQRLHAAGTVVNGFHRDTKGILDLSFPCFSYGSFAQDQGPRGKVLDYRVKLEINGVKVNPGDLVFGDRDGVVIVPQTIEDEVIERSFQKVEGENMVGDAIRAGMPACEAWEKYHVM